MLDKKIRDFLISAFEHLQQQTSLMHSALTEVSAVRNALIEIGPKYEDILTRHRVALAKQVKPVIDAQVREYDLILQRLREPGNFV
jgi:hypothetical protein